MDEREEELLAIALRAASKTVAFDIEPIKQEEIPGTIERILTRFIGHQAKVEGSINKGFDVKL